MQDDIQETDKILDSIKTEKIVLPILIGLGVVFYVMYVQLDRELFKEIPWNAVAFFWLGVAVLMYVLRHLFYAWRLRILTDKLFSWWKSIELIFIWEFSSAVSPTSIGGAAVALFLLAQEKLSAAKTVSVVVYTMVIDTLFFMISLPLIYLIFGPLVLRPGAETFGDLGGYGITYFGVIGFMIFYSAIFFYGLFIRPERIQRLFLWMSNRKILKRFSPNLKKIAGDIIITSKEIRLKTWSWHLKAIVATSLAWITRFLAINFIIIAIISAVPRDLWTQALIYGRGEAMHTITQFSPTPGGSGITEYLFGGFYDDFIPAGIAIVVAFVWRLITYYPYLVAGAIVIPNWISKIILRKRREKVKA